MFYYDISVSYAVPLGFVYSSYICLTYTVVLILFGDISRFIELSKSCRVLMVCEGCILSCLYVIYNLSSCLYLFPFFRIFLCIFFTFFIPIFSTFIFLPVYFFLSIFFILFHCLYFLTLSFPFLTTIFTACWVCHNYFIFLRVSATYNLTLSGFMLFILGFV